MHQCEGKRLGANSERPHAHSHCPVRSVQFLHSFLLLQLALVLAGIPQSSGWTLPVSVSL